MINSEDKIISGTTLHHSQVYRIYTSIFTILGYSFLSLANARFQPEQFAHAHLFMKGPSSSQAVH